MSVKVYRYGLLSPTTGQALVEEQMRLAHRYRNTLTEIERGRRAAKRAAVGAYEQALALLEADAHQADQAASQAAVAVKAAKAAAHARSAPKDLLAAHQTAKERRRAAAGKLRLARTWLREDPDVAARLSDIDRLSGELQRSAREHCGVYWGTYLLEEDRWQASAKMPLYDGIHPTDPRFIRWSGDGSVGVQIQKGMDASELEADTRLRVVDRPITRPGGKRAAFRQAPTPGSKRSQRRRPTELWLRVGSDDRAPIWATWPMVMHRPLPEDARIKRAQVTRRMVGPRAEWSVQITIEVADPLPARRHAGTCAVDLGWRLIGDEVRVVTWRGEDGGKGEIRLGPGEVGALRKADELASIRRKSFDRVMLWLTGRPKTEHAPEIQGWLGQEHMPPLPAWYLEATRHARQWKSAARLEWLLSKWRENRFPGDEEAFGRVSAWRKEFVERADGKTVQQGDRHLWLWETSQRRSSHRMRKDLYRREAARLAERYDTLVLEAFNLRDVSEHGELGKEPGDNERAQSIRQLASPSECRLMLTQAFVARGGRVVKVDPAYSTHTCPGCGKVEAFDAAKSVHWRCGGCGRVHDQDKSAAEILLARYREQRDGGPEAGGAREGEKPNVSGEEKEGRWARAKRMRAEKAARTGGARKEGDRVAE